MERGDSFSSGLYRSLKNFWKRRPYRRLDGSNKGRKRLRVARMGGRRRRIWRLRLLPRLKIKWVSPKKLLIKLRDAYVNMMLNLADSRVFCSEMVVGGYGAPSHLGSQAFGRMPLKEYDEKVILELYRQMVIQGQVH